MPWLGKRRVTRLSTPTQTSSVTTDNEPVVVKTNSSEALRVTSAGDVTMNKKLTVVGGATANGVVMGTDVPGIDYPYEYETVGVANGAYNLRLQSPNAIFCHTGAAHVEALRVTSAGDVTTLG